MPWPWPCRFPWLIVLRLTQRQDAAEVPPGGQRPIGPGSSPSVGAQIAPLPSTVKRCASAGPCRSRCMPAWSRVVLCWRRPATTARRLVTASTWSAAGSRPWRAACVNSCRRWALRRPPGLRPMMVCSLSPWALCWRTKGARWRHGSRTARSALGSMSPSGNTPRRNTWANQRASAGASVYFRPLSGGSAAGWARGTRSAAAINPSTSPYQVEVDATTTPVRAA